MNDTTTYHALVLMPEDAAAYAYGPILATIDFDELPDGSKFTRATDHPNLAEILNSGKVPEPRCFLWGEYPTVMVDCSRIKRWVVTRLRSTDALGAERLATNQADRLSSGLHPAYWTLIKDEPS